MTHRARAAAALPVLAALLACAAAAAQEEHVSRPGQVEGRPPPAEVSPLQARVDAAAPGGTVTVEAGDYPGDLLIDKPLRLVGQVTAAGARPRLLGSGTGSVVRVRAPDVTLQGFDIDGRAGVDLGRDPPGSTWPRRERPSATTASPTRSSASTCARRTARLGPISAVVEACRVRGIRREGCPRRNRTPGHGVHVWNTQGFRLEGNAIADVRDGFYIQSSSHGTVAGNDGPRPALRPPLHVLGRQPLRGKRLRDNGGGHRADVLQAHPSCAATSSSRTRATDPTEC